MYDVILFDLDGTLTDSGLGITNSVAYSLKKFGIEIDDRTELYKFIGPPLRESFEKYYGFSPEEAGKAVEYYREYFSGTGVYQNVLLEGVPELLQSLKAHGRTVAVASSKPEHFVRLILAHFQVDAYFDEICGASMDESRINKEDVIEELLGRLGLSEADQKRVLMVGDRRHDVEGAVWHPVPGAVSGICRRGRAGKSRSCRCGGQHGSGRCVHPEGWPDRELNAGDIRGSSLHKYKTGREKRC